MAKIKPFKAIIFNQEKIKDLSKVVCPPYDVISASRQEYYHSLDPHNFIRIILGKEIPTEDKYVRAGTDFKLWQKEEVFVRDEKPAIYFYSHEYTVRGEKKVRLGFISLLHLEDKNSAIFGHEHTHVGPKEDRLKLLRQVGANLSPIFVIFPDKKRVIQKMLRFAQDKKPFIHIIDDEKNIHKLWRIDSPEIIADIQAKTERENIFIADGHHRYEVACAYRDEMSQKADGSEGFNFIMVYFTNTDSRGLTVLPIHRLVKAGQNTDIEKTLLGLKEYFDIEEIKDKGRFFFLLEKAGNREHVIGMYKDKKYRLLRLKNIKILDKLIADKPPELRPLDVSILNQIILKKVMGINVEDKDILTFSQDSEELINKADKNRDYFAFFLNPVKVPQITAVALKGNKMPPKSTFFYPKVLSGLVINKFDG